ncbi:mixed lineage kinase domain-like protein [Ambystoma mexicanum]|uniref:mixed lineage kinase domain-like protein n=1 Tax=Ambystoma mexicanum TaxID=8296 RepID=UPI0037E935C4
METVEGILGIAQSIYSLCEQASCNRKQCKRLRLRIEILMVPVDKIRAHPEKHQSKSLITLLQEMLLTMKNAKNWVFKYTRMGWWKKMLLANSIKEEFEQVNERMGDAAQGLALLLQAEQRSKFLDFFQEKQLRRQNAKDAEADLEEIKKYFQSGVDHIADTVDYVHEDVKVVGAGVQQILAVLTQTMIPQRSDITEIKPEDLVMGEPLMETDSSVLYKGEYHKATVAIKRFKDPLSMDIKIVRSTFEKEAQTMRKFRCPHILCIYGICINNAGTRPSFSIVMEYCEKGTLRQVLEKETELSWDVRLRMALDAARALYRLHQTEVKPFMHGSINSSKFLVDARYCVKLAGFELSKTESSIKRASPESTQKEANSLVYLSPQRLSDINYKYDKASEIYSFGIVLWEIASKEIPLKGFAPEMIFKKICLEKHQDPLPADCPSELKELINQCRAYDPTQRPSAGVIVDTLASIVNQMQSEEPTESGSSETPPTVQ